MKTLPLMIVLGFSVAPTLADKGRPTTDPDAQSAATTPDEERSGDEERSEPNETDVDALRAARAKKHIDAILTALEARSNGLRDIRCKIKFIEEDQLNLTTRTKEGEILFRMAEPNPQWAMYFSYTEVDGLPYKKQWYLFDGRWLYQAFERTRQITQQEIAAAGEKRDMFDLDEAPFPVPFGQKKDKILRNFDVTLAVAKKGDPPGCDHLVCIPKKDSRLAEKYASVEFFILRDLHLPIRVIVTKKGGYEVMRADFPGLSEESLNVGLTDAHFAERAEWKSFDRVIERRKPKADDKTKETGDAGNAENSKQPRRSRQETNSSRDG